MVHAMVFPRPLHGDHILRLCHNADETVVALGVSADRAQLLIGQVLTDRAEANAVLRVQNGLRKALRLILRQRQDIKRQPLRRLHADAGQTRKLFGQPLKRGGKCAHQNRPPRFRPPVSLAIFAD